MEYMHFSYKTYLVLRNACDSNLLSFNDIILPLKIPLVLNDQLQWMINFSSL